MTLENPDDKLTASSTGALEETAEKERRALDEALPGYIPGMTAGQLADRVEDEKYRVVGDKKVVSRT